MARRGGQLPWGSSPSGGLYGNQRQGGAARMLVLAAIASGVLAVVVFLFMKACGGTECKDAYCASGQSIATPEGYERVTRIYEFNAKQKVVGTDKPLQITLPLREAAQGSPDLSFFRYVPETKGWEPLAPAVLDPLGKLASGTLTPGAGTIAVMRRLSPAGRVVAYLPHNGILHPEAISRVTVVHTLDFAPGADGAVLGDLTDLKVTQAPTTGSVAHYPVLGGNAGDKQFLPIVNGLLDSPVNRSSHVQQIVKFVVDKQLAGIDIAYLDLAPDRRTSFALFIGELGQALKGQNKVLTVTIPAPIRTLERIDEGAYDWAAIAQSADFVKMWPQRDQSTFRKDMPAILTHLVAAVQDPSKIIFTVSPWSTEKTTDGVTQIAYDAAMVTAARLKVSTNTVDRKLTTGTNINVVAFNIDQTEGRSGIVWSPETASVVFTYELNGGRTVWIENNFSIGFKLEYVARFKLGGIAIENATSTTNLADIWPALVPFISSGQPILVQPNANDLAPKWRVSKGTAEGGTKGVLSWATPAEPGTYTVTLSVSDGVTVFENELPVSLQAKEQPATTPSASPTAGR
jgi:Glycosyl hydrolases family 18